MDCSLADRRQPNSSSSTTATTTDYTATPATAALNRPQHQYTINQTPSILKYQHQTAVQSLDETFYAAAE
ncbi:hypothetical protein FF38_00396 [Lucilia cuprina]|uniref:Uncharacterized protein n=1 Tax=Lucilia cuprina TaxID=7375 RepID=A0A0L0C7F4_LUCCU|nr:hypothetical protein FF38_00396 [Lucilia cuprina]